jgi:hypothetical protein
MKGDTRAGAVMLTGRVVRAARSLLGWRQEDLGLHAGCSAVSVRFYEADRSQTVKTSLALESAFASAGVRFNITESRIEIVQDRGAPVLPLELP